MQLLVVTAAADQTGRTISLLVAGLVGIAVALTALTVWYWRRTDPKRRARSRPMPEPQSVELVKPRQDPVGHVGHGDQVHDVEVGPSIPYGVEPGPSIPDDVPVGVARPIVASIPPPASPPSPKFGDDGVVETGLTSPRHWVDPDVWVDAFASDPDNTMMPLGPERPPDVSSVSEPVLPRAEAEPQKRPVSSGSDARRRAAEEPPYPSGPEPQPAMSEPRSAGHSLSDVDWDVITQATLARFAETESSGPVEVSDQSPVR